MQQGIGRKFLFFKRFVKFFAACEDKAAVFDDWDFPTVFGYCRKFAEFIVGNGDVGVTVEVGFGRVTCAESGNLIVPCYQFFFVGIVDFDFFSVGIAGITKGEVGPHFLCDQDGEFVFYSVTFCRHISSRVGSNGKFTKRQGVMMVKYIVFDVLLVFFL